MRISPEIKRTNRIPAAARLRSARWILACLAALACVFPVQAAKYEEGVHYYKLRQPQPVQTGDKIEVLELFWYHCPHCFALEPVLVSWLANAQPPNSEYVRMPGIFRRSTIFDAKVYYTLEALGVVDDVHQDVYEEIHVRKNPFKGQEDISTFLKKHGINEADFKAAFDSFAVDTKMKHAQLMFELYEATGVPTIIVDGKYRASASTAGGHQQLMELTNFLVDKAAGER